MDAITRTAKQALMQQVLDQKLSRTELLDLIIHRVHDEIDAQLAEISREEVSLRSYALKDFIPLARERGTVEVNERWREDDQSYPITIKLRARLDELPASARKQIERRQALHKQDQELRSKHMALQKGKYNARIAMIRESLDSTPQGKKILEAIEALKDHVRDNLLNPAP